MTHIHKLLAAAAAGITLLAAGPTVAQGHDHNAPPAAAPPAAEQPSCPRGMPMGAGGDEAMMQHMAHMQQMMQQMQQMHADMKAMHDQMMQMRQQMQQRR